MARKITQQAINAFLNNKPFDSGNTTVIVHDNGVEMALHGNCIASMQNGKLSITNAGWFSNTTKERLNALPNVSINQRKGKWFLNGEEWDGKPTVIN